LIFKNKLKSLILIKLSVLPDSLIFSILFVLTYVVLHAVNDGEVRIWWLDLAQLIHFFSYNFKTMSNRQIAKF